MSTEKTNRVEHPSYYQNKKTECIEIIRHYTCDIANVIKYLWREGEKEEKGLTRQQKAIEDLKKAIWYLEDYRNMLSTFRYKTTIPFQHPSGKTAECACHLKGYIKKAFNELWWVGLIVNGMLMINEEDEIHVSTAIHCIKEQIREYEKEIA